MKNFKKEIPSIIGALAATSLTVIASGLTNSTLSGVATKIAANFFTGFSPNKIKRWFFPTHPDQLNHSIKKLFVASIDEALFNINILFSETKCTDDEKKEAKQLIKTLQKHLPDMLMDAEQIQLEEAEIKHFLYEKEEEDATCRFIETQFADFGITEPFKSFLAQNLPAQIQLCFGEGLKDPNHQNAWIAFQRMLMEEMRNDIKKIADTQQSIKEDLSDLKFEKSGFSKEQVDEIHQLVNMLNNKKLIEVKIKDGLNQSLQSIESNANEVIKITTETNITVTELKTIIEKLNRQTRTTHVIIYSLAVLLLLAGAFIIYKFINQPFTTTIQIYGWENEHHNPLDGKGAIVLRFNDKTEKAEINRQGEAIFKGILPEYNGKTVAVYITDTDGEDYYLADSLLVIQKNNTTTVQVLLHGLEKLQGTVYDNISGEGLPDVTVTLAGITSSTNEKGDFIIEIPVDKQRQEQEIEVSKTGYKSKRQTIPMSGEHKYRTVLERN